MNEDQKESGSGGIVTWVVLGATLVVLLGLAFIIAAAVFPSFRVASYQIALSVMAIFQIIIALLLIALLLAILYAVSAMYRLVNNTVLPKVEGTRVKVDEVLENMRSITGNVRESTGATSTTTVFVAEQVASPIIRISSLFAGVRAAASALSGRNGDAKEQSPM